jgi:hypothetical protein
MMAQNQTDTEARVSFTIPIPLDPALLLIGRARCL